MSDLFIILWFVFVFGIVLIAVVHDTWIEWIKPSVLRRVALRRGQ